MQWYLDASKKQQRLLDEADFVNEVLWSHSIVDKAEKDVRNGTTHIDLLGVQKSIDELEQVFFKNGIRDEVLSPT